jgi:hypothetical protein
MRATNRAERALTGSFRSVSSGTIAGRPEYAASSRSRPHATVIVRLVDHPLAIRTGVEHCCLEARAAVRVSGRVLSLWTRSSSPVSAARSSAAHDLYGYIARSHVPGHLRDRYTRMCAERAHELARSAYARNLGSALGHV